MTEASKHPHHWDLKFDDGSSLCPDCREGVCQCEPDMVNSPAHYGSGSIECIEYIEDFLTTEEYIGYLRGNIAKYLHRFRYKNGIEDLRKAEWYLNRLSQTMGHE